MPQGLIFDCAMCPYRAMARIAVLTMMMCLVACGGGGGGGKGGATGTGGGGSNSGSDGWIPGLYSPSESYEALCASPRFGTDPYTGQPYPDAQGDRTDENNWLRSWSNESYLWYDEITDRDPARFATLPYFDLQRTTATTASGAPKDRFHYAVPTSEFEAYAEEGVTPGYGAHWAIRYNGRSLRIAVAYTEPGAPATAPEASLTRGETIEAVDGVDVEYNNTPDELDVIYRGLFPERSGETHEFEVSGVNTTASRMVTLTSVNVTSTPVRFVRTIQTPTGDVGYLLFNEHIATAEQELVGAVEDLEAAGISDLVVDVRYNGGGYLAIASQLAYMIAGPSATDGQTFESLEFNDKHPYTDPETGQPLAPFPFLNETIGLSLPPGRSLPSLELPRVFVLTGSETCSASESVINSLRGVGVEVVQIGSPTCGKPYGFYPHDNCGTTYFSINFKGVNALGFGDFPDGFGPENSPDPVSVLLPGCSVADGFYHALGDPQEARLAAALAYRAGEPCPPANGYREVTRSKPSTGAKMGLDQRPFDAPRPWRTERILHREAR